MKWTKLELASDHDLGLSQFELPWLSCKSKGQDRAVMKIKYLGPAGRISQWRDASQEMTVRFQRRPLKVFEIAARSSSGLGEDAAFLSAAKAFLKAELTQKPDEASKYLELLSEVVRASDEATE